MKLAYFYCNRAEDNRREPDSILSTIIQQLAQSHFDKNKLIKPIVDIYRHRKNEGQISSRLSLSESQELLVQLTDIYPRTMICIDALDEVAEDKRKDLLKALNYVIAKSKNLVKIFATTRMNPEIVAQFKIFPRIELQPDDNVSDINQFVETRVKSAIDDSELLSGEVSDELKIEICEVLCKRSKGM
jgi:CRISPR/Cas system-associated protein Cas5 (RAMP superfamily)